MSLQVENLEHNMAKLTITVSAEEVEKALQAAYLKQRSKISLPGFRKGKVPRQMSELAKDSGNLSKERNVLQEAKEVLPVSRQMVILERLIQVDIDLADAGKTSYRNEAIELLQEVIDQGWDTYETYNNLVILNEKQGNLTEAQNALDTMKEQFGDDYNIEKRAAFLEIDKQEQKANKNRDYTAFAEYYEKAEKMYYEQLKNNDTDAEMDLLENVYQQVRSGGWIEE